MEIVLQRTDDAVVGIHGFGDDAFQRLPGKEDTSRGTTWKTMVLGDVRIVFFKNGV